VKDGVKNGASKGKEEELRGKAIKVIDLLQHSAELGHLDALYTLARVSLVSFYFPR
jgi:SEL1 protein